MYLDVNDIARLTYLFIAHALLCPISGSINDTLCTY